MVAFKGRKAHAKTQIPSPYCAALVFNPGIITKDACNLIKLPHI